jgi:hypothetical protein
VGLDLGRQVAALVIERGMTDGSDTPWDGVIPVGPDKWTGTNPALPTAGKWQTWVLPAGDALRPAPPYAYDGPEMAAELAELRAYQRTPRTNLLAQFWEWGAGGGRNFWFWNDQLSRKLFEYGLMSNPPRAARAYALMNTANHDSVVACWDAKYTYWAIRPSQLDPTFQTLFAMPNHPSYPSAHSCLSGANAGVLAYLFPRDAATFHALTTEAGEARIWAGLHFRHDIVAGEAVGEGVAAQAVERAMGTGRSRGRLRPLGFHPRPSRLCQPAGWPETSKVLANGLHAMGSRLASHRVVCWQAARSRRCGRMNPRDMASQRLAQQLLTESALDRPEDVVGWLGAVQAQEYAGAKWGIGLRTRGLSDGLLDRAFDEGRLLRTHLLRPTWHFVTPADIRWLLALTGPRVHAHNAHRYRELGLEASTLARSHDVLAAALAGGRWLTRPELAAVLEGAGLSAEGQRMPYLLMHAELEGVICSGPRRGKQFTYALLDERVPAAPVLDQDAALAELARRYLRTRGPATVHDFAWWSGLTVTAIRQGHRVARGRSGYFAL